ncbi:ATP-dependent RNA helicase, putative [Trypanosoma brucei gambiense DAL972]|uniref:ATP-dependent RNA helicase, putative n=1 Tax=Trypanosoma brucei gambiense (strain MHOM/CI/86/DAL972) TaxID=679716 RepID=C9ZP57_TRYB9|nr:ATP-dependent RNA helicase, putative [Trypanosoma brucei gambiense DAL972]CBH11185.1 ATP-dependent RNA helicase, putative [Trypanosoma brucei gambiense DAL972]|eukprot:XP_011773472.1 ATP-dependent RNA helicase, putative [Trypanosoma brucei gambiense DAL972]
MMAAITRYSPHSERTRVHYERFLRDIRRWLPPGLDDSIGEVAEETLSIVCRAGSGGFSGSGAATQLQNVRKQLETLFDSPLSAETLNEVLQYGRLIDDFVSTEDEPGAHTNNVVAEDGLSDLLLMQEGKGQRKPSDMSSSDSDGDTQKADYDKGRDLMKFAADVDSINDGFDDQNDDDDANCTNAIRVTFEEVACNPNYIRDSLRRLFPTQTIEECDLQAERVLQYCGKRSVDQLTLETQLTAFLGGYDDEAVTDWIATVAASRWDIVYGMSFASKQTQKEKSLVMDAVKEHARTDRVVERLYQSITGKELDNKPHSGERGNDADGSKPLRRVDLQAYAFKDERTPHQYTHAVVPQGTKRAVFETHDEVILPPTASATENLPCTPLAVFPEWARPAFPGVTQLNPMQSKIFECAFRSDENMLVCAPTGAGKTNVAMMAILRAISNNMSRTGLVNLRELKVVYVAPMKALVQEVVRTFSARLEPLGLAVIELTGDSGANQAQVGGAQLIVTTPEKWDVVTRKSVELGVASLLKLLIIDEVHLLHNERGPVLEAIVARTLLQQQHRCEAGIRLVGLSATLPNFHDVASFLQVDRQRGLFVFDSSYRPIPLQQTFCAVKKVRGTNQAAVMNLVVYDKVLEAATEGAQSLVFVHSRKDTDYTALYIVRRVVDDKRTHYFVRPGSDSEQVLREAVSDPSNSLRPSIQQMLPFGFAVHHAGMSREERSLVESLFAGGHVRVLVCTSTLAWGVNLPAHQVIIKGTRVFNAAKGETELLNALDVLQMFGRAGRVGFGSTLGRAAVITSAEDLQYYLSVLNNQLPIESQMMRRVVDMLNAEVVLGHITNLDEGVRWLQRTYLYIRMRRAPEIYGARASSNDPLLLRHLGNIVHTAADDLRRSQMVEYDSNTHRIATTSLGRIASHYYLTTTSMATYLTYLCNTMHDVDLFRLFSMSKEFSHIIVRPEEQSQLQYLLENAPIAVRESRYTPLAKINVLLQCYISNMNLQGLPLMSEMSYVKDSAQRILRALYEISLVREYGRTAQQMLQLYLMTVHQQWAVQSPARQLRHTVPPKVFASFIHALESRRVSWEEVRSWSLEDLVEKLSDERRAEAAYACIRRVPHFIVEAAVRPLTRRMLYVDVDITPDFMFDETVHTGTSGELVITVEHTNGRILHCERINLRAAALRGCETVSSPTIVVPVVDPKPTHYFVRCHSMNWLGVESSVAISLMNVLLPDIAPPLLEVHHRPPSVRSEDERDVSTAMQPYGMEAAASKVFPFTEFFQIQHDLVAPIMENRGESFFVAFPPGSGKTAVAEIFILKFLLECAHSRSANGVSSPVGRGNEEKNNDGGESILRTEQKLLYLTATEACATRRYNEWRYKFGEELNQRVAKLEPYGEELAIKAEKVRGATIIISCGSSFAPLLRHGAMDFLSAITHVIVDHVHLLRAPEGRWMEECVARLQSKPYIVNRGQGPARLLALSYPLISCTEVSRWMKVPTARQYNYGNSYRQLRVRLEAVEQFSARSRYAAATISVLKLLQNDRYAVSPCVIFVPTAQDAEELARRIVLRCRDFVPTDACEDVEDRQLALLLASGVAYMHRGSSLLDELNITEKVERPARHPKTDEPLPLYLVCSFEAAWRLPAALFATAFVCAAERIGNVCEEDKESEVGDFATDCSVSELLQMTSRALNEAVVYCRAARRWVWSRLLNDPLPIESHLRYPEDFRDTINTAVAQGRARDMPDVLRILQSHYFLHHLRTNLHFYGVPSKEDIPAYASEFARSVIASLQRTGCVTSSSNSASSTGCDGDELTALQPTPRGVAAMRHGISIESLEAIDEAVSANSRCGDSVTRMWRVIASCCVELTPQYVGDAARIVDIAELSALHVVARAFPHTYDVQYLDMDFSKGWTKVHLLVLAHCARMFVLPVSCDDGGVEVERGEIDALHPFASRSSLAVEPQLLLQIPHSVAERLLEDLNVLLPVVLDLVRGVSEIFDGRTQWRHARCLMRLLSQIERRVWGFENPIMVVPCVQETPALQRLLLSEDPNCVSYSLERLQELCDAGVKASKEWCDLAKRLCEEVPVVSDTAASEALVRRLRSEVAAVPRVVSLSSRGTIELTKGGQAFVIRVTGRVLCACSTVGGSLGPWWIACVVRHSGREHVTERLMALRTVAAVVEPTTRDTQGGNTRDKDATGKDLTTPPPLLSAWSIEETLSFPLHAVDGEDLDTITMVAIVISARYRADAEVDVTFAAG